MRAGKLIAMRTGARLGRGKGGGGRQVSCAAAATSPPPPLHPASHCGPSSPDTCMCSNIHSALLLHSLTSPRSLAGTAVNVNQLHG